MFSSTDSRTELTFEVQPFFGRQLLVCLLWDMVFGHGATMPSEKKSPRSWAVSSLPNPASLAQFTVNLLDGKEHPGCTNPLAARCTGEIG